MIAAALLVASGAARAQTAADLRVTQDQVGLVAKDALWGGVAGAALSGGFVAWRLGVGDAGADWKPALATGVGLGLAAGLIWGLMQASRPPTYAHPNGPVLDGLTYADMHPSEVGGKFVLSLPVGRF